MGLDGRHIVKTVVIEGMHSQPDMVVTEEDIEVPAHLDAVVGWDEDIVGAVDALFTAYERSHGLL